MARGRIADRSAGSAALNRARWALVAAAATGVQVGLATVASRYVVDQTGAVGLAFMRYLIGFVCLAPVMYWQARTGSLPRIRASDWLPVCLLGIGQFAVLILLLNIGLQTISASRAALLFATMPLATWLLSALLTGERLTPGRGLAIVVALGGVAVSLSEKLVAAEHSGKQFWGEAAVLASALVGALCSVLYRPYLQRCSALQVGTVAMLASTLALGVLALWQQSLAAMPQVSVGGWLAILFVGVSSGAGYFLWLWALGHQNATRVTAFLSLSPICAALFGSWLLAEPISGLLLAGLLITVTGLVLASRY